MIPVLCILLVAVAWYLPEGWTPRCSMMLRFGIPCPACGSMRALHLLAHGDVVAAFLRQPFMFAAAVAVLAYSGYAFGVVFGPLPALRLRQVTRLDRTLLIAVGMLYLAAAWGYTLAAANNQAWTVPGGSNGPKKTENGAEISAPLEILMRCPHCFQIQSNTYPVHFQSPSVQVAGNRLG